MVPPFIFDCPEDDWTYGKKLNERKMRFILMYYKFCSKYFRHRLHHLAIIEVGHLLTGSKKLYSAKYLSELFLG